MGMVQSAILLPVILYRIFKLFLAKKLTVRQVTIDLISIIIDIVIFISIYDILDNRLMKFDSCLLIILASFIVIIDYLRIVNEVLFK